MITSCFLFLRKYWFSIIILCFVFCSATNNGDMEFSVNKAYYNKAALNWLKKNGYGFDGSYCNIDTSAPLFLSRYSFNCDSQKKKLVGIYYPLKNIKGSASVVFIIEKDSLQVLIGGSGVSDYREEWESSKTFLPKKDIWMCDYDG